MLYIFDLDGTLTDTLSTIAHFGNEALTAHGLKPFETERYKSFVGDGMDVLIHRMLAAQNADSENAFLAVRKTYDDAYKKDVLYDTRIYEGIPEALSILKKRGDKLAVLSNKPHHVVIPIVDTLFGKDLFNLVRGQTADMPKKPAPDGALFLCGALGFPPNQTVFIGDTNVDIMTGKNAGMKTIGVLWGFRGKQELEKAGADRIISAPQELTNIKSKNQ